MCGIYGYAGKEDFGLSDLENSIQRLEHRGPDDRGFEARHDMGISMCRLAINEVQTGQQPYLTEDSRLGVVFNGEIYNYNELSKELGLPSHTSEAEIICALFIKEGPSFVSKLDGMFATAIADFSSKKLYLFRDPFGKKPLWLLHGENGSIEFASEIKAFRSKKNIREDFVSEYLMLGYVPFNRSAYIEIESVPAGSYLVWDNGDTKSYRYWELNQNHNSRLTYRDAKEETYRLLKQAVRKRLISERPIGVFLSGGYDSSVIAALMQELSESEVNSYTIGFNNAAFDESVHARNVAKAIGTNHHEELLTLNVEGLVLEVLKKVDLPFSDSSIFPTYLLNKFASKDIVVALAGDGGDEMFGGYDRYVFAPLFQNYHKLFNLFPTKIPLGTEFALKINRKLARIRQASDAPLGLTNTYESLMSCIKNEELDTLIKSRKSPNLFGFRIDFERTNSSNLRKMMLSDVNNYLHGDLLVKTDLASMFNSLEVRSPMLDKDLAKFVYSLPDNYLVKNFSKKIILKDIGHDLIPKKILARPKMGFGVPMDEWLRNELKSLLIETIKTNRAVLEAWFDLQEIDILLKRQFDGEDLARIIWPIFALSLWAENYL